MPFPYTRDAYEVEWNNIEGLAALPKFSADPAGAPVVIGGMHSPLPIPLL